CPSEYLRSHCPLCFGGKGGSFDAIICLDTSFTQKHNKQKTRDPHCQHPRSIFIPEMEVKVWEHFVKSVRPPKASTTKKGSRPSEPDDGFEGAIRVPNSVLDGCEQSFTAADETREKASGQFFDSTALMGLLCRHD
ncbi:hypothetical protein BDP27DRAFT_1248432, partial [Rhodocollybia butyracea]